MKIISHAGGAERTERNTIAAFQKALKHHVDEVEFDVRVTADKIAVVHHHPDITAADGSKLCIKTETYAKLKQGSPALATLEEALDAIRGRAIAHLEVKRGEDVEPIVTIIKSVIARNEYRPTDLIIASRSGRTLRQLHSAIPEVPKSVIEFWSSVRAVYNARSVHTKRIDLLEYWLWSGLIRSLTHRGYQVCSFNSVYPTRARLLALLKRSGQTNDPKRLQKWQRAGLYGVITDFPDRFEK